MRKVREVLNNAIEKIRNMTVKQKAIGAVSSITVATVVIGGILYYVNLPGYEEELESNKVAQVLLNKNKETLTATNATSTAGAETSTANAETSTASAETSTVEGEIANNTSSSDDNNNSNTNSNATSSNTNSNANTNTSTNTNSNSNNTNSNSNNMNSNSDLNTNNNNSTNNSGNSNSNSNNDTNNNANNNSNSNSNNNTNNYPAAGTINYEQTNSLNSVLVECGMQFSEETNNNTGWLPALENYALNGVSPTKHSLTDAWGNTNGDIIEKTIPMENKTFTYDNIVPLFYRGAEFDEVAAYDACFVNYFVARNDGSGNLNVTLYHMIIE